MQDLSVVLLQSELHWENAVANRAMFEEQIASIHEVFDVLVLPEMFTTGFSMQPEHLAEAPLLATHQWMKQIAAQYQTAICGSYIVKDAHRYYNRFLWMNPDGTYHYYDKRHLFRMAGEDEQYTAGVQSLIIEYKGWKICPLICYDLRFPVWSRNVHNQYDVLLYVANWPSARALAWNTLLKARAIENVSYVVGVNRVGDDAQGLNYVGDSAVYNFKGETLACINNQTQQELVVLSKIKLNEFRTQFPAWKDADDFKII